MSISVVTAADSQQLTTVSAVKSLLGLTTTADDALLGTLIDRASIAINNFCLRSFAAETLLETLAASGRNQNLRLARFPIISVSSVQLDGVDVDSSLYTLQEPELGFLFSLYGWRWTQGQLSYAVTYQAGFKLPGQTNAPVGAANLPADIEAACIDTTKVLYLQAQDNPNIYSESVPGVYSVVYHASRSSGGSDIIPGSSQSALLGYRDVRF